MCVLMFESSRVPRCTDGESGATLFQAIEVHRGHVGIGSWWCGAVGCLYGKGMRNFTTARGVNSVDEERHRTCMLGW
jgi:hypothetical protein